MKHRLTAALGLAVLLAGCTFELPYRAHLGTGLPEYTGTDIDGKPISTADFKGKIVVVVTEMLDDHFDVIQSLAKLHADSAKVSFLAAAATNNVTSARPTLLKLRATLGLQNWTLIADDDLRFVNALGADSRSVVLLYNLQGKLVVETGAFGNIYCTQTQLDLLVQGKAPQSESC